MFISIEHFLIICIVIGDEPSFRFTFFVISHSPLEDLCHSGSIKGSRFWNNFTVRTLGLLEAADISQLIDCANNHADIAVSVDEADIINHCGGHPLLLQKTLNETTQAALHGWTIDMENLQLDRGRIYEMLWHIRNKRETALLFSAISDKPLTHNKICKTLHQRGLLVNDKPFCQGFAKGIPEILIPVNETIESFLSAIKKNPDKALKKAERWGKWFELLVKNVSRAGKLWKLFKDEQSEE